MLRSSGGRRWSQTVADTAEALHAAARALGIPLWAAQMKGMPLHYDLPTEYRERALAPGVAEAIATRELVRARAPSASGNRGRALNHDAALKRIAVN